MSVPVGKRSESRCQAVYNATIIKSEIHSLCCRHLGIKNIDQIVRRKYLFGSDNYENREKYVMELYQSKKALHMYSDMLLSNTRAANRSSLDTIEKCNSKIEYQEKALDVCEMIIAKFQDIVDVFLVDVNKYQPYVKMIDDEIALIKKWEQYVKKIRKSLG